MAITSIKSTYALDVDSVRKLEELARRWKTSRSEALRRMIRAAAEQDSGDADPVQALDALQASLQLDAAQTKAWLRSARSARRSASERGERRNR